MIYCIVPYELAEKLHDPLRRHFRADPDVEVIVERRGRERRRRGDRRDEPSPKQWAERASGERRLIRAAAGRRAGERRAPLEAVAPPGELPRRLRRYAEQVAFVERVDVEAEAREDLDTARLVARIQAGDSDAFGDLYLRFYDRIYGYLKVIFRDSYEAEDGTQDVFANLLETLPSYERRRQPFRAYLFTVVRNYALTELKRQGRLIPTDPATLAKQRDAAVEDESLEAFDWITDNDLLLFVERLPLPQRQAITLRYLLDMSDEQIAAVMGRSREDVRMLNSRATKFLRERLNAVRSRPERRGERSKMQRVPKHAVVLRARRFSL